METIKLKISYSLWILALFATLEVLLFKTNNALKLSISILEYLFVLVVFLLDRKVGIMYFFSFILLTIGTLNYNGPYVGTPVNFWGLRLAGFSVSILFTILLVIMVLLERKPNHPLTLGAIVPRGNYFAQFMVLLTVWGIIVGAIRCVQGINYTDEYIEDILSYTPVLFYLILLSRLSWENVFAIVKYAIPATIFMMLISALTGHKMYYSTEVFVVTNAISTFFIIFLLLLWRKYYKLVHWYIMLVCLAILVAANQYMLGGKVVVSFFIVLFGLVVVKMRKKIWMLLPLIVLMPFLIDPVLSFFISVVDHPSISHKIWQVKTAYDMILDPLAMAQIKASVGVTVGGEMVTVGKHLWDNPSFLLFGEGFGGGVPDYYGVLGWTAGNGGFDINDLERNCFTKMHLPIFEMPLKGGMVILLAYLATLYKVLFSKPHAMSIMVFLSLLLVFYITKEFILLTLILAKLTSETNDTIILPNENKCNHSDL
jgi:hypothetical protein